MPRGDGATRRGDRNKKQPQSSNQGDEQSPPTLYPTYLATTYSPTLPWPTYAPTLTEPPQAARKKRNKGGTKKGRDQVESTTAVSHSPSQSSTEAEGDTFDLLGSVSKVSTNTTQATSAPTGVPTGVPTAAPTKPPTPAPITNQPSPMGSPSRYYGERMPSSEAVSRPFSHGGLGTEVIPTPSPVELVREPARGPSRQSGGRGSSRGYGGGRGPSAGGDPVQTPTVPQDSSLSSSAADSSPSAAPVSLGSSAGNGQSEAPAAAVATEKRFQPVPLTPTRPPTSAPTSAPTAATPPPTSAPTPAPMAAVGAGRRPSRPSRPTGRQPSRPSRARPQRYPTAAPVSETVHVDTFIRYDDDTEPADPAEVDVIVPPEILASIGKPRARDEPKQTTKLNLSFPVKEVPNPSSSSSDETAKLSLKFYGRGQEPASAPVTEEPTYIVYPTYSPTKETDPPTYIPTYAPSVMPVDEARPSQEFASGRNGEPSLDDETRGWTWKPTPGDGTNEAPTVDGSSATQDEGGSDSLSSMYDKRICPGYPFGIDPMIPKSEQEVFFAYGIQTTEGSHGRSIEKSVERMQLWVLEDVAQNLLRCPNDEGGGRQDISRVYYVKEESVATMSECTPTVTNATDCAIVQSAIYLTATYGHEEEARAKALSAIHHRLERGSYEQGTILHTSYLGPDLDKLGMFGESEGAGSLGDGTGSSSSTPTSVYIAIGVFSLVIGALAVFLVLALRVRKERNRSVKVSSCPAHRSAEMTVDDLHIPYSSSSRPRSREQTDRRSLLGYS